MKEKIHPDYHPITVKMTDGFTYETRSTWGKPGDVLQLDVDTKTHPAWVGGSQLRKTGQMEKFNNKFAFLEAKTGETKAAPTAKAEAAPKAEAKADAKPENKAAAPKKKEDKKEDKKA